MLAVIALGKLLQEIIQFTEILLVYPMVHDRWFIRMADNPSWSQVGNGTNNHQITFYIKLKGAGKLDIGKV